MIDRRTLLIGGFSLLAAPPPAPTVTMPVRAERVARAVSFTIHGWAPSEPGGADPDIVPLHVSNSWRAAWM